MNALLPRSLFGRTAFLLAGTLLAFSTVVWLAINWIALVPSAGLTADMLTQRATVALAAHRHGGPLPEDTRIESAQPHAVISPFRHSAVQVYLERVTRSLQEKLHPIAIVTTRIGAPFEIWVQLPELPERWIVLSWRIAHPSAPFAVFTVLCVAALLTLGAAAWSARRIATPLSRLAAAAAKVAEGETVHVDTKSGPSEVRSLAVAFESMSHRLAENEEQRELMLAGISHDLRSPLARIRIAVELLDDRDAALVQQMSAEIATLDRMIGSFLHYVRANYNETTQSAVLDDVVREALAPYAADSRMKVVAAASEARLLAVDSLRHIVVNLVQNALDHGAPPVVVTTSATESEVKVAIEDAGAGMSAEDWQEALRPFNRLRAPPADGHTGLGLALVERLLRAVHGRMDAKRSARGFIIVVTIPAQRLA